MAVKDNNGLIYGIGKLKFNNKEIGWISQEGLSPKGEAKQTTPIYAAQVQDGPVDEITSSPGTTAFGFKLIQLKPEMCKDLFGGTIATADGAYEHLRTSKIWKDRSKWNVSAAIKLNSPREDEWRTGRFHQHERCVEL